MSEDVIEAKTSGLTSSKELDICTCVATWTDVGTFFPADFAQSSFFPHGPRVVSSTNIGGKLRKPLHSPWPFGCQLLC